MARFENKDLTGALFKNEYKQKPNQPDLTGTCRIGGVDYKIAAWTKTTQSGKRMISMAYTEMDEQNPPMGGPVDIDDEILF